MTTTEDLWEARFDLLLSHMDRLAREMKQVRELTSKYVNAAVDAEAEIPEKIRRFTMYMHDVHSVSYMYEERGQPVPQHVLREMERCDDRYRQLLKELHAEGNVFEKVRREMAEDPENRWDHTRLLLKPNGDPNEAR